jgi:hypothetical protein
MADTSLRETGQTNRGHGTARQVHDDIESALAHHRSARQGAAPERDGVE